MSSINPHYTFTYAQPDAYRFSHDSVFLARGAFEAVGHRLTPDARVLDLCAGCGIVGLDFLFHLRRELGLAPAVADFVEVQAEYESDFTENVRRFGSSSTRLTFHRANFASFRPAERYDVILCNPPYFRIGSGKVSPSAFKTRCRFFVDGDWAALEACVRRALGVGGTAFVLTREPERNRVQPEPGLRITRGADVRGTALWQIDRESSLA